MATAHELLVQIGDGRPSEFHDRIDALDDSVRKAFCIGLLNNVWRNLRRKDIDIGAIVGWLEEHQGSMLHHAEGGSQEGDDAPLDRTVYYAMLFDYYYNLDELYKRDPFLDALLRSTKMSSVDTIFCAKDRFYCETGCIDDVLEGVYDMMAEDEVPGLRDLIRVIFAPKWRWGRDQSDAKFRNYSPEYSDLVKSLRGNQRFRNYFDAVLTTVVLEYLEKPFRPKIDKKFNMVDIYSPNLRKSNAELFYALWRQIFSDPGEVYANSVIQNVWLHMYDNNSVKVDHVYYEMVGRMTAQARIRAFFEDLTKETQGSQNERFLFSKLCVGTESRVKPHNLVHDGKCLTCVLGPGGEFKKVALLYEIDPYVGVMRLIPRTFTTNRPEEKDEPFERGDLSYSFGFTPIFQVYNDADELCWLVDGVDVGVLAELAGDKWKQVYYKGIIEAARDCPTGRMPVKVYFNDFVKNRNNVIFNDYLGSLQGKSEVVTLRKRGGNQPLRAANVPRPQHFIEAFQYRENGSIGTMWIEDNKDGSPKEYKAKVIEVDLRSET